MSAKATIDEAQAEPFTRKVRRAASLAALALIAAAPQSAAAASEFVPGEVIVRFQDGVASAQRGELLSAAGARVGERLPLPGTLVVEVGRGTDPLMAAAALERLPGIRYAEPNFIYEPSALPNDNLFDQQWALRNTGQTVGGAPGTNDADIDAPPAWDLVTDMRRTIVAVVDSGVQFDHPDLAANLYLNPGESGWRGNNGVDDDGNGFADDFRGWDFADNDNDPSWEPIINASHGSHVAGTIGAVGNNGNAIAGVGWGASVMPLRTRFETTEIVRAFRYAAENQVRVINGSFGGGPSSQTLRDMIAAADDVLFVFAAGNGGGDGVGDDNDTTALYPCSYNLANVVCVAASDQSDRLASFSNYGDTSVDLTAPGVNILSTVPYPGVFEDRFDGSSLGWITTGTGTWGLTSERSDRGGAVTDSPNQTYSNNRDAVLTSGVATLGGRRNCSLTYWVHVATQATDTLRIQATSDTNFSTTAWSTIATYSGSVPGRMVTQDLPPGIDGAQSLRLRLRFTSDAAGIGEGVYVDSVIVVCPGYHLELAAGTSMAAPHVSGTAGLIFARHPQTTVAAVHSALLGSVDLTTALAGKVASGGRLNANRALREGDFAGPAITITSEPAQYHPSRTARFTFTGADSSGPVRFRCRLDSNFPFGCTSPYDTGTLSEGSHSWEILAADSLGNRSATIRREFVVDTTQPGTVKTFGPRGTIKTREARFEFVADEEGVAFECRLDDDPARPCSGPGPTHVEAGLTDGQHEFEITAVDRAGNRSAPMRWSFAVDVSAPQTVITDGPANSTRDRTPTFRFGASEPASFRCRVDEGGYRPCESPQVVRRLGLGRHTFHVVAVDVAGNVDPSAAGDSFKIKRTTTRGNERRPGGIRNQLRLRLRRSG